MPLDLELSVVGFACPFAKQIKFRAQMSIVTQNAGILVWLKSFIVCEAKKCCRAREHVLNNKGTKGGLRENDGYHFDEQLQRGNRGMIDPHM